MPTVGLTHFEFTLLILLVLAATLAVVAKHIQIPYPIVLVIGGLLLGIIPGVPRVSLDPNVVFLVFLPPLLFSASFHISWREFRNDIISILMLAFGLVGFTLCGVAWLTTALFPGFDLKLGFVLGAVVATTDAIAATATAKRLGLPRRIVDLLEAESLVNDGSGLVALKFTSAIVVTGLAPTVLQGVGELFYLIAAGVVIGLAIGFIAQIIQSRIAEPPIEITFSLITPYITYLIAEAAHCSGVLATIACGLYLGRRSSAFYSLHARIESSAFWRTLDFILNGMVFLLLGLQLPLILADIHGLGVVELIRDAILFSAIVILLRLIWVFPGSWIARKLRASLLRLEEQRVSPKLSFLVGWAGMRGVLALAAALSLPERLSNGQPFPERSLIIFLAFSCIFATLVLQGLSMPALIRRLGLAGPSISEQEERTARFAMVTSALSALRAMRTKGTYDLTALEAMENYYQRQLALLEFPNSSPAVSRGEAEALFQLAHELRQVERSEALKLRDEYKIHDEVLRTVERELDLMDARFKNA